jgi:prepilin-type N-terminal cleavage/methylation domain-containing protein
MLLDKKSFGFTLIEVIVSISILTILLMIGNFSFQNSLNNKNLNSEVDNLVSKIEEVKTNAVSGKGGQNYGIKFNTDSFVSFIGSSYIPTNDNNVTYNLNSKLEIIHNIPGQEGVVVFSKLKGENNHNQDLTITVREKNNNDKKIDIIIGSLGETSIIQ